jgi:Ca-activated chloride channel family protein
MKRFLGILTAAILLCGLVTGFGVLSGCGAKTSGTYPSASAAYAPNYTALEASAAASYAPASAAPPYSTTGLGTYNTEEYDALPENGFVRVTDSPVSTFSADVDTASYCNVRRMIDDGCRIGDIPSGAVRTEELLNYFTYDYSAPEKGRPFGLTAAISTCPWNEESQLLVFGITTKDYDYEDIGGCNYVFLIDTSGSMADENKLSLIKEALHELLDNLHDRDRISIITYSGSYAVLADGVYGDDRNQLGSFRTPGLRNVAARPPYMHAGKFTTLEQVIRHYMRAPAAAMGFSEIKAGRKGNSGRIIIQLSEPDVADLVAFLSTLSGPVRQHGH